MGSLTLSVKLLLLLVFVTVPNYGAWNRLERLSSSPARVLAFLALWGISVVALFFIAFLRQRFWRYFWTAVFAVSSMTALSHSLITRDYLRLADLEQLLGLLAFTGNVLNFYAGQLVSAALVCAIGIVAMSMPPPARGVPAPRARRLAGLLPLVPVAAIAAVLLRLGGDGADGLPVQFTSPAFLAVLGLERLLSGPEPRRTEVAIAPTEAPRPRNVIVIMDESVRGDLLDLNRPGGMHSGLLEHSAAMANFGIVSSIANCSAASNAAFRYGVGRDSPMSHLRTNPSIWQYAKRAGYRTIYIDGQRHNGALHNLMTREELAQIDEHIQHPSATPPRERDMQIARRLRRIIQDGRQPSFVYVNKTGAHFPYEGKYPPERAVLPVLKRATLGEDILPRTEDPAMRASFRNAYLNTLAWNVGNFFDTLLADLDLSNTVIVYTSDHGQNLHEDGSPGYQTHCSTHNPSPLEGIVPLVVLTQVPQVLAAMREAARKNRDRVTQFNIFPSVLALIGYSPGDVARSASSELPLGADLPAGQQQFATTFFTRFGRQPVWNAIGVHTQPVSGENSIQAVVVR
jgi:sulfatase-like protein